MDSRFGLYIFHIAVFMKRCCKSNHMNSTGRCYAPDILSIIFVLILCLFVLCGCGGTDRYVEIVVAGGDVVITPVPAMNEDTYSPSKAVSAPSETNEDEIPAENLLDEPIESIQSGTAPNIIAAPELPPIVMPTYPSFVTITPDPIYTALPTTAPTPVPTPTPAPVPTPDPEKLMRQELDDVYGEYVEEWELLYKEYEAKCAVVLSSLDCMGPLSDDPEYIEEYNRLTNLLDMYDAEFIANVEELDAVYFAKYSAVYDKYGM